MADFPESAVNSFRAIDRFRPCDTVLRVTPTDNSISYNSEFPLREVFPSDEIWNYAMRTVTVKQTDTTIIFEKCDRLEPKGVSKRHSLGVKAD